MIDWFGLIASKRGVPDGWRWYQSEVKGDRPHSVFIVRGAVPSGTIARGKHKGKPKYDKSTERELIITRAEMDDAYLAWERDTGKCSRCEGDGETLASASADGTRTYRACSKCNGAGSP